MKLFFAIVLFFIIYSVNAQEATLLHIAKMPFNTTGFSEYNPVFYKGGIVFCSNRENEMLNYIDEDENPLLDIYYVDKQNDSLWGVSKIFSEKLTTNYHDGPVSFNQQQNIIYFSRNNVVNGKYRKNDNRLGVYISELQNNIWSDVKPFEYNLPNFNYTHPSLSDDGKMLFFSSDKSGGYGKTDIWWCKFENGAWTQPQNLGDSINTGGSEMFPYYHKSGRLYFASDKQGGKGGFDIYYSTFIDGKWQKPVALEEPINSKADDFSIVVDSVLQTGYFASNRDGSDDIFSFNLQYPIFETCDTMKINDYCYVFFESGSITLDTMPLVYEWDLDDGVKIRGLEAEYCFSLPGKYLIELNVKDTLTGEIYQKEASYEFDVPEIEQPYINTDDTVSVNIFQKFDAFATYLPSSFIDNYYWDFGDGFKEIGDEVTHVYTQQGIYRVKLGVITKPDSKGIINKYCVFKDIVVVRDNYQSKYQKTPPRKIHIIDTTE